MTTNAHRQLVGFLEREVFDPVLRASSNGRSDADRRALEHVQRATGAEIERFRSYGSAEEVLLNFKRDLSSSAAKPVHRELRRLGLPTLHDRREEFEKKAVALGIHASA